MKYNNNDHDKYVEEYNRLYELFDQDPQEAVYTVMDLENKVSSLKRTIDDYKVEITYYRNTINKCNCNSLKETQPPGRIDIFLDTKTK